MRRGTLCLVGGLWLVLGAACSAGAGEGDPQSEVDGVTEGGCECPNVSLECLCAEFPGACPSYDDVAGPQPPEPMPPYHACWDDTKWWMTELRGCGKLVVTNAPNLGGFHLVYDEVTHELIGAGVFSDVAFGSCGSASYQAGVSATCDEGTMCSLCGASGATCAPVCSIDVMKNTWGAPAYEDLVQIDYRCSDPQLGAELRVGCGKARVVYPSDTYTFSADTHELLAVENELAECGGVWGDPGEACPDETVCSLCDAAREATCRL